jgi:hypothetical protein
MKEVKINTVNDTNAANQSDDIHAESGVRRIVGTIILRGLVGILIGIGISYIVSFAYSIAGGSGVFMPVSPFLIEKYGTELRSAAVQLACSAAIGFVFAGASVIFNFDTWSILKQTVVHFIVLSTVFLPSAWFCWWVNHTVKSCVVFCMVFIVIYAIMWASQIVAGRCKVRKMNEQLKKK